MATNMELVFAEHPEVFEAWTALNTSVKHGMDLRRYELATFAAAQRLGSSYCSLAHGKILIERFDEPVIDIATDRASAGLDEVDLAVMAFAEQIVDDTGAIGEEDLQRLRDLGLSDKDILDVVLAATVRCFFAKTLDALCTLPDASYAGLPEDLREVLVVGRPIAAD
jgi:alkylhydroperoxidase family enzyme